MLVKACKGDELIFLGTLGNRDSSRIKIAFQTTVRPRTDCGIKCILCLELSIISCLGILISSSGSCGSKETASRVADIVTRELGTVFASQGNELITLGALGNLDAILIKLLESISRDLYIHLVRLTNSFN